MYKAHLRKVGGSIMLAIPPNMLDMLHLSSGAIVNIKISEGKLIIEPKQVHYTLDELLAQCDTGSPLTEEDKKWLDTKPMGREL